MGDVKRAEHPAHEAFAARYARLRAEIEASVPDAEPWRARVLLAAADGLQLQWLHDPTSDMADDLERLAEALGLAGDAREHDERAVG